MLQDIHWSWADTFGLFPGYALGNVIGTQLFAQARNSLPNLDDQMAKGEFSDLLTWLQTNLYQHGRKFSPNELVAHSLARGEYVYLTDLAGVDTGSADIARLGNWYRLRSPVAAPAARTEDP